MPYIQIKPEDDVVVATKALKKGETILIGNERILLQSDIPAGHKIAVREIPRGEKVIKYGYPIGVAIETIHPGDWVHTHNVKSGLSGILQYSYAPSEIKGEEATDERTFMGYKRPGGEVGIRNEIWILNTVGCINKTGERLARMATEAYRGRKIDGIFHFPHPFGCSQLGDDLRYTQRLLASMVHHPNAAGVLVMGLGCENNHLESFKKVLGQVDERRVKFLKVQEVEDETEEGLRLIDELVRYAEGFWRQPIPVSKLKVGLKCGGSDAFSGITANPLVGRFSDRLVDRGGTTILTEVPEMFGAEEILMNRAVDQEVFEKTVHLINHFKEYFIQHGQEVYENPSPGNKEGGITTLEEKSLGCIQKGGERKVVDVMPYGHRVSRSGLNLVQAPGNDLVSVSALAASGAHLILFTTGRGTPFGGPVPTVKISSNSPIYEKKKNWIDFNAGQLLEGRGIEELSNELFDLVVRVASGALQTRNEMNGFREIAIFKDGVTL